MTVVNVQQNEIVPLLLLQALIESSNDVVLVQREGEVVDDRKGDGEGGEGGAEVGEVVCAGLERVAGDVENALVGVREVGGGGGGGSGVLGLRGGRVGRRVGTRVGPRVGPRDGQKSPRG